VEGEVVTSQEVEGTPATVVLFLEVPEELRQHLHGAVHFTPFAVDGRGAFSPAEAPGQTVRFELPGERVQYTPLQEGHTVFLFDGPRPPSQYVAIGVRVQQQPTGSQVVSADAARVEVLDPEGRRSPPQDYRLLYGNRVRAVRGEDGQLLLVPQTAWDPERLTGRSTRTHVGLGLGAVGVYVSPTGEKQVDYLFPYVVEVLPAAKPVALDQAELEQEVRAAITALESALPSVEEVLRAYGQGSGLAEEGALFPTRLLTFPNPFNSSTQLLFHLAQAGPVQLSLYDLLGQKVRTLVEGYWPAGAQQVEWDGRNEQGQAVASGIYLCRLQAAQQVETRKLLLLR